MNDQLALLKDQTSAHTSSDTGAHGDRRAYRRLDEHTREIGRKGLALAREALRQAAARAA
jgi:hypothetical protein